MPYLTDENLTRALEFWRRDFPAEVKKTLERAEQEREGRFSPTNSMASGRWFFLGSPVNWSRNPTQDPEFTWLVNRFWHLVDLGRAWRVTRETRYVEGFIEHVRGWKVQNPVDFSLGWDEATYFQRVGPWRLLETGLRSESLLQAWQLMKDCPLVDEVFLTEFETLLADHAEYLCRFLGSTDINHAMMHMLGPLLIARHLSSHPRASWWRHIALERFELCLRKQVSFEGVHQELTPGYHNVSAELFARPWLLSRLDDTPLAPVFGEQLRKMARFTEASLRPDGRTSALGDWDHDHSSAQTLSFLGACLGEERLMAQGTAYEEVLWKVGPDAWEQCRALIGKEPSQSETTAFADAGYYVMRDPQTHLFFDAAPLGGPHGHADALSFELTWNKTVVFPDPGRYTYEEGEWRRWFKGTAAHAAVQIDLADQTPYRSTQAWGEPEARVKVRTWQTGPRRDYLVACHDGYRRLDDPVDCERRVLLIKGKALLVVVDCLEAKKTHQFDLRFPLNRPQGVHLRQDIHQVQAEVTMTEADVRLQLTQHWFGDVTGPVRLTQEPGWIAERYGHKEASVRLCLSGQFQGRVALVTVVQLGPWKPLSRIEGSMVCSWDSEASALRLSGNENALLLGPDGCIEEEP